LKQNNIPEIQNALTSFDNNLDDVLGSRGTIGGAQAQLEQVGQRLELTSFDVQATISEIEDLDFAE